MIKIGICSSHTDRDRLANIAKSGADYVEFCLNAFENCEGLIALVSANSYAHQYCIDHQIQFRLLEGSFGIFALFLENTDFLLTVTAEKSCTLLVEVLSEDQSTVLKSVSVPVEAGLDHASLSLPDSQEPHPDRAPDVDVNALREEFRQIMRRSLNVIRCEEDLQKGMEAINDLLGRLGAYPGCYLQHRRYTDLLTALITMESALERKGSKGCHCRMDAAEEDTAYRVIIKKDGGNMNVRRAPV